MFTDKTIEKYESITNISLGDFFDDINYFFKNSYPLLVNFYSGKSNSIEQKNFQFLNNLISRSEDITNKFNNNSDSFSTCDFWDLLDTLEDVKTKLQTCTKLSKYLRSSISQSSFTKGLNFNYTMSNNETIENVSSDVLKNNNFDESWVNISLSNDLKETDWTISGGKILRLTNESFQNSLVTSMIDNTIGERIYGKDIYKKITFEDDDLKTLSYKETVFQTVDILSTLSKGQIPEFPQIGINGNVYKGVNINQMQFSSLVREYTKTFSTDDLFKDFKIVDLQYKEGDLYVKFAVNTKYDLVIFKDIKL